MHGELAKLGISISQAAVSKVYGSPSHPTVPYLAELVPYQLTYFGSDAWSSGPTPSALPSPISSEPTTVPADDRLRFHDDEDALPVSPDSAQQHPKHAVDIREPWPFHGTAEDGELLPKSDILESQLATSLEGGDESGNQRRNHAGMVQADRRLFKFGARG